MLLSLCLLVPLAPFTVLGSKEVVFFKKENNNREQEFNVHTMPTVLPRFMYRAFKYQINTNQNNVKRNLASG